ncbi:MAG: hypothetical protein A2X22_08950 [Bacteroidetes bacterium GWF2_49_14]|nr:MAG: hypothetical protein A2X22_08950 [Bacteroidetes bacterium GWF2_49_14]
MSLKTTYHLSLFLIFIPVAYLPLPGQEPAGFPASSFRETVWLQSDRHIYLSGEEIWFNAKVLDRLTLQPSLLSRNLRVELTDAAGNRLVRHNLVMDAGSLSAGIHLGPDLSTGWYYLRAYTNWMRNFDGLEYAVLPVKVVNPRDTRPVQSETDTLPTGIPGIRYQVTLEPPPGDLKFRTQYQVKIQAPEGLRTNPPAGFSILIALNEPVTFPDLPIPVSYPDTTTEHIIYAPETRSGLLTGRVSDQTTGTGIAKVPIGITLLISNQFEAAETDAYGYFSIALPGLHHSYDFIANFISQPEPDWTITLLSAFDDRPWKPDERGFRLSDRELEYLKTLIRNRQILSLFPPVSKEINPMKDSVVPRKIFFDPPDRIILTDNYVELANVRELVYEVVPDVTVRKKGENLAISVYNSQPFAEGYPTLVLLDGIPITRHNELLELPPSRIRSIEVKNKVYIHGNSIFSSIVNFVSRNADFAGLKLPETSVLGTVDLPEVPKYLSIPDPDSVSPSTPVINTTLLWQTGIKKLPETISFKTNDLPGKFRIIVYGFAADGALVYGDGRVVVTRDP